MRCILIVRYSLWSLPGRRSWWIGRQPDARAYRDALFSTARLDAHQFLFERLTLPSLVRQTHPPAPDWFRLIVVTSTELPEPYRGNLKSMLAGYGWAQVIESAPDEPYDLCRAVPGIVREFAAGSDGPLLYATVRMDDDDALGRRFFELLGRYCAAHAVGSVVSLARGYSAELDWAGRRLIRFSPQCIPKIAAGLAMVHRYDRSARVSEPAYPCIYAAGNHNLIDRCCPIIVDTSEPAFLRTLHTASDSYRPGRGGGRFCSREEVRLAFDLFE
jgi:hypothetical protein